MPGLPPQLEEIPLEYFVTALRWLQAHPAVDAQLLGSVGASKGGELVLLLASMFPDFKAVVAFVPPVVVFQSIAPPSWPKTSSWSYQGKPLPFVPYVYPDNFRSDQLVTLYEASLAQPEAVKRAMIAVERINGPILFLTGKADTLFPATRMADMAIARLRQSRFPFPVEHLAYDNAGHEISRVQKNPLTKRGGTVAGNGKAQHDAQKRMVTFFKTSLR
jgi:dienelactone hydrolase